MGTHQGGNTCALHKLLPWSRPIRGAIPVRIISSSRGVDPSGGQYLFEAPRVGDRPIRGASTCSNLKLLPWSRPIRGGIPVRIFSFSCGVDPSEGEYLFES